MEMEEKIINEALARMERRAGIALEHVKKERDPEKIVGWKRAADHYTCAAEALREFRHTRRRGRMTENEAIKLHRCGGKGNMEELIKRQDAIDAVAKSYRYESDRLTALQELPTVDIEKTTDKLAEYEDLEEQGNLLNLPCAVGDTVFDLVLCDDGKYHISEMKVCNINPFGDVRKGRAWNVYLEDKYTKAYRSFYDFDKTVFLTKEEAEAALRKLRTRNL